MKIIKSSGEEAVFNKNNILKAVQSANMRVSLDKRFSDVDIKDIAKCVEDKCKSGSHTLSTSDIQVLVENEIMSRGRFDVAREYITYRYQKALNQRKNTTDNAILALLSDSNEELKQENANKNPTIINVQRDYMAGEMSKDISERYLIPEDIWKAHKEGIIHFHDTDYFANPEHNCDLVNLEDMLQNGTVVSGYRIDKPHRFSVAATIASQIAQQVSSSQYGGQTMYISHLSPFVEETRKSFRKRLVEMGLDPKSPDFESIVEKATLIDVEDGVQTFMYQLNTMSGTNGQAPFISLYMHLEDVPEGKDRDDLAMVCRKILEQRIVGLKNASGAYVSPAFPKILYVLDEDNIHEDSKYWDLTVLAATCTSKRMVPDYISAKIMRELKDGNVYGCMGCVSGDSVVRIKLDGEEMTLPISDVYDLVKSHMKELDQFVDGNPNKYIDTTNIELYVFDSNVSDFVKVNKVMKNIGTNIGWKQIVLNDGHVLKCTENHIITTNKFDEIEVKDITDDNLYVSKDNKLVECKISLIKDIKSYDDIDDDVEFELI